MLVFAPCAHSLCLSSTCSIHVHSCIQHLMSRSSRSCISRLEFNSKVFVAPPGVAAMAAPDSDSMLCAICRQQMVPAEDCERRCVHSDLVAIPSGLVAYLSDMFALTHRQATSSLSSATLPLSSATLPLSSATWSLFPATLWLSSATQSLAK
jgi:hypothetical protein